jgi:hypothetical protein
MAIDFNVRDTIHNIMAWFVQAFLPSAKKPFNLKAKFQPELDVHAIASKADVYNIHTDPAIVEEGANAFLQLLYYLTADGYKIKTPLFTMRIKLPGEYTGDEIGLPEGVYPEVRVQVSAAFRNYIKRNVKVKIAGIDDNQGHIGKIVDEATGKVDEIATIGSILVIKGYGLKIEGAEGDDIGVFFKPAFGAAIQAAVIPVNEPMTLKIIVPTSLIVGTDYKLSIRTRSSVKHGSTILKKVRTVAADFPIKAANP